MAKFEALPTLFGIMLYYIVLILGVTIIANASLSIRGINDNSATVTGADLINNMNLGIYANDICTGTSELYWRKVITANAYYLPCSQFHDLTTCNSFDNCNYSISSFLGFNTSGCEGIIASDKIGNDKYKVNLSIYGFPLSDDAILAPDSNDFYTVYFGTGFCDSYNATGLDNRVTCEQFGCTWINATEQNSKPMSFQSKKFNTVSIWKVMSMMVTFSFDFGFDPFINIILGIFLVILLPILIGALIYYMFVPG